LMAGRPADWHGPETKIYELDFGFFLSKSFSERYTKNTDILTQYKNRLLS
jgi:hypothetical protein